jgi:DNA-binding transcriptional MocR family regulator
MESVIDLRLNYPVLSSQGPYFKSSFTQHVNEYTNWLSVKPFRGYDTDRELAAAWLSREGEEIGYDRISLVTGGHHGILVTLLAAGLREKVIVTDEFTYPNFKELAGFLGIKLVSCHGDEKGMVPESLKKVCTQFAAGAIYIMPTLHNPTGHVMPVERRLEIINVANDLGIVIIEDDAYGFLEEDPPLKFAQLEPGICWYIYSLSKPLAPDIKVGYIVSPLKDISVVSSAIKLTTSNPSTFFSSYVSRLIGSGELELIIREKREEGRKRRLIAQGLLNGLNTRAHENGWHLWVGLPMGVSSDDLNSSLLKENVLISPSSAYRIGKKDKANDFFRISLGGEKDIARVIEGITIVKRTIQAMQ